MCVLTIFKVVLTGKNMDSTLKCPVCGVADQFKKPTRQVAIHGAEGAKDFMATAIICAVCENILLNAKGSEGFKFKE